MNELIWILTHLTLKNIIIKATLMHLIVDNILEFSFFEYSNFKIINLIL